MGDFNQSKYINDFIKETYDTIKVQVPKGKRELIRTHANGNGYKSLNSYINALIDADMNAGEKQTPCQSVSIQGQKNVVMGSNHGNINIQ